MIPALDAKKVAIITGAFSVQLATKKEWVALQT